MTSDPKNAKTMKIRKYDRNKCPKCKKKNIMSISTVRSSDDAGMQWFVESFECQDCLCQFDIRYRVTYSSHMIVG